MAEIKCFSIRHKVAKLFFLVLWQLLLVDYSLHFNKNRTISVDISPFLQKQSFVNSEVTRFEFVKFKKFVYTE